MNLLQFLSLLIFSFCTVNDETKFASNSGESKVQSDDANRVSFSDFPKSNKIVKTSTIESVEEGHAVKAQEIDKVVDYHFVLHISSSMQVASANATQGIKNALNTKKLNILQELA